MEERKLQVTCDRCKTTLLIGPLERNIAQYPDGWMRLADLNIDLCDRCAIGFTRLLKNFMEDLGPKYVPYSQKGESEV